MWARMASGAPNVIPATDEYGIIVFYVKPDLIPGDFDFMESWYAPDAMDVPEDGWTVEGTSWHQPDNFFPHHYKMIAS